MRPTDRSALLAGYSHDDWVVDGTTNWYTDFAGVLIETGSCGATESFRITSGALPQAEGCFQSVETSLSTLEEWSVSGNELNTLDEFVVSATVGDGTGEVVSEPQSNPSQPLDAGVPLPSKLSLSVIPKKYFCL